MRHLPTLLSMLLFGVAASRGAWADAPTVTMTSPPANAIISAALTPKVLLQASITDPDEAIAGVSFYVCLSNGTACITSLLKVGEVLSPPYQFQWTPSGVLDGGGTISYLVQAQAFNVLAQPGLSPMIPFSVIQPPPGPSLTLVVPNLETGYITPTAPVLYATASPASTVPSSTIASVDFLDGGSVIGTVTTPNSLPSGYAFVWQGASPGVHLVAARATDTLGDSTTSSPVTVNIIGPDPPPQLTLSAPTTGQIFAPSSTVPLTATAISALGTIQRVEFSAGGMIVATALSAPYAANWANPLPGTFAIVAKAFDDMGVAATSPAAYIKVLATARSPSVVLTAPAPGATVPSGTPLPLEASALAPDGSIGRVDFYAGTTLLGSAASAPYQFTWPNPSTGAQSLTAKAYDLQGASATSALVTVTVAGGAAPVVSLTAPASGATFAAPATIGLSATASEAGGSIAMVEFFANSSVVGTTTTPPYNSTWGAVAAGNYMLTAKATDNLGTSAISSPINVTVLGNATPSISLTAPQTGAQYAQGQPIVLTASAATPARTIDRVEFYADAALLRAVTVPGTVVTATVSFTWNGASVGAHALSAKVFATDGTNAASSAVNATVSDLGVTLTEPFAGQVYQAPGDIRISANPTETTGTIVQVDFFGDGAPLGSATAAPYSFLWSGVATGTHTVSATARDGGGLTASSGPLTISVVSAPTLDIDAGIDGSTVADDNVSISGIVQAPPNSTVMVNGQLVALDSNGRFFVDNFALKPGANPITVSVVTQDGHATTNNITLNSTGNASFEVDIDRQEGIVPFDATLTAIDRGNVPFQRIEVDTNDDGAAEVTLTALPDGRQDIALHFVAPGTYATTVKVFDAGNNVIYSARRSVLAWEPNNFARRTIGVYTGMLERLRHGDVDSALMAVTGSSNARFRDIFTSLGADLATIVDQLGTIKHVTFNQDVIQIFVVQPGPDATQTFTIEMIRGEDGIWRIENM